ncbi:MAG: site-specific integrase [Planctomycetota bacterium]
MNLHLEDVDSQRMVVWVRYAKGYKDRSVPLPAQTLAQLRAYWLGHRPKIWLSPSQQGTSTITPTACNAASRQPSGKAIYART